MPITTPPSQAEIDTLFVDIGKPAAATYEFALVLGGTVSAGAYTAGVIDFIIEALDEWTIRRDAQTPDPNAPPHKAILKLVTGTSGGGVCAAVLGRALAYDFPHVTRATDPKLRKTGNPFYDLWVNNVALSQFLDTADIQRKQFVSLLNGDALDQAADLGVSFTGPAWRSRSWVADPLRLIVTLTNLKGVPYQTSFAGGAPSCTETFIDHADSVRFAIVYPNRPFGGPRPDEFVLGFGDQRLPQALDWTGFGEFAEGTSAFPLGFPPRVLQRPMEHYRWRVTVVAGDGSASFPTKVVALIPDWTALTPDGDTQLPDECSFLVVDGGATDNEPIALARNALAGMLSRNPRDPKTANRGLVLVDPFAGSCDVGPSRAKAITDLPGPIIESLVQQTRYDTSDLLLATDDDVSSRFMVTPLSSGVTGARAIASAGFAAFIGFACRDFMRYDYLLGRANAQTFLKTNFLLHRDNPVFDNWPPALKASDEYKVVDPKTGEDFLPIIPLMGTARIPETLDSWPRRKLDPESYRAAIEARFRAIVQFEGSGGLLLSTASWLVAHLGQRSAADYVIRGMNDALKQWKLD